MPQPCASLNKSPSLDKRAGSRYHEWTAWATDMASVCRFHKIDDLISYLMVRIDPDKVTPLRDEAMSRAYLRTSK